MVLVILVTVSVLAALIVAGAMRRLPIRDPAAGASTVIGRELRDRSRTKAFLRSRLEPGTATGLALTIASAGVVVGGVVAGLLFYVVRARGGVIGVDTAIAGWSAAHATPLSTTVLRAITHLGSTSAIVVVSVIVGVLEYRRIRSRSIGTLLLLVVGGQMVLVNLIKLGVDRARPALDPLTSFSGASFPSGHTTAAAACYAALALIASRGRPLRTRAVLVGGAVGIAVAVGCSRMMLGVHWFTDVIAGLAVGYAWFALCAIAVGGQLMRFGAPAEETTGPPTRADRSTPSPAGRIRR